MDRLLRYVFAGSRGGGTRIRIVMALLDRPQNVNQLAKALVLDYKTVDYNLRVLLRHVFVVCPEPGTYGALYRPSKNLLAARGEFDHLAAGLRPATADLGKPRSTQQPEEAVR